MKKFNNLFNVGFSIADCDEEDISNIIALFVNEDIDNIELFGFNVYFAKVADYHDKRNFGAFYPRRLVVRNSHDEIITDMVISADMRNELRESILDQVPSVRESLAKERALLDSCHSKEFGSKAECSDCTIKGSCKILFEHNNRQVLNMQGATLHNWKQLRGDNEYSGNVIDGDGNEYNVWLIFKPELGFSGMVTISDLKFFDVFKVVDGEILTDNDDSLYHCDKLELARFSLKGF